MRESFQRIAQTSGAQVYSLLVAFVTLTLTARWLGPGGRGTIAAITAWVTLFGTLGHLSVGQVAIHRATVARGKPWLASALGSLLLLDGVITTAGWLIVLTLVAFTGTFRGLSFGALAIGFLALPFYLWEQFASGLLIALDRVAIYNKAVIVGRTVSLVLVIVAWRWNWGVAGVLIAAVIGQAAVSVFGIRFLLRESGAAPRAELATITGLLKGSLKLHINSVAAFLITSSSILIISHELGSVATGHYNVAVQLIQVLGVVPQAASMVMFSRIVQLGPDAAWVLQRRLVACLLGGMMLLSLLAGLVAPWLIPLVLGEKFVPAIRLFEILLLTVIGTTLGWGMMSQWIGRGMFLQLSLVTTISAVVTVAANLLFVRRFGVEAAAWASVASYVVIVAGQGWIIFRCESSMRRPGVSGESIA